MIANPRLRNNAGKTAADVCTSEKIQGLVTRHRARVENKRRCLVAMAGGSTDPLDLVTSQTPKVRGFVSLLKTSSASDKTYFYLNPIMASLMLFARPEDWPGNPKESLPLLLIERVSLATDSKALPGQFEAG